MLLKYLGGQFGGGGGTNLPGANLDARSAPRSGENQGWFSSIEPA